MPRRTVERVRRAQMRNHVLIHIDRTDHFVAVKRAELPVQFQYVLFVAVPGTTRLMPRFCSSAVLGSAPRLASRLRGAQRKSQADVHRYVPCMALMAALHPAGQAARSPGMGGTRAAQALISTGCGRERACMALLQHPDASATCG